MQSPVKGHTAGEPLAQDAQLQQPRKIGIHAEAAVHWSLRTY